MTAFDINKDTIAAIATPPGVGGISVIRISGRTLSTLAFNLTGKQLPARQATLVLIRDQRGVVLDQGLALFFPAPGSFTGDDVLEFQGHGGVVVTDSVLARILELGARLAEPGEFSKRAYLNGKLDLIQAEAIADLIGAVSRQAAQSAIRSLEGEFSNRVTAIADRLTMLRVEVEAALDFPDEEIDLQDQQEILLRSEALLGELEDLQSRVRQGNLIREGVRLVLAGAPNVGKSSLLNRLVGKEAAIVAALPGTTRDLIREQMLLGGMPVEVVDTAGLRAVGADPVEEEGMRRTRMEMARADHVILVTDLQSGLGEEQRIFLQEIAEDKTASILVNKCDLAGSDALDRWPAFFCERPIFRVSAKTGDGLQQFISYLQGISLAAGGEEGVFIARRRHLEAINRALHCVSDGVGQFRERQAAELLADDLLLAQTAMGEITGKITSDDLLGKIFGSFCIGK